MNIISAVAIIITLFFLSNNDHNQHYYVSMTGNDINDCMSAETSCATVQRVADSCGRTCSVRVAVGHYSQRVNVTHHKTLSIQGDVDNTGKCVNRSAVTFDDNIDSGGAILLGQDNAIITASCITLEAYRMGSIGMATRQFAVADGNEISCNQFPGGACFVANESSKINIFSPAIYGNASRFAMASDLSQISIGGNVHVDSGVTFDVAFISNHFGSIISYYPTSVSATPSNYSSYQCVDSIIRRNTVPMPGNGKGYTSDESCRLY